MDSGEAGTVDLEYDRANSRVFLRIGRKASYRRSIVKEEEPASLCIICHSGFGAIHSRAK